jgi:hypothetical protein
MRILVPFGFPRARASLVLAAALVGLSASAAPAEEPATQTRFKSPTAAMQALVAAARAGDRAKLVSILGPEGEVLVNSGDDVEDVADRKRFAAKAAAGTRFETLPDGSVIANLGPQAEPFAIPLVKDGDAWRSTPLPARTSC